MRMTVMFTSRSNHQEVCSISFSSFAFPRVHWGNDENCSGFLVCIVSSSICRVDGSVLRFQLHNILRETVPQSNGPLELRSSIARHIYWIFVLLFSKSGRSRQEQWIRDQL
ncbi:uncharacterized protein [Macrobrachium rosenbergii]|uniref:uncharacterized protein n=1 Tax=Macrobrachium rosenbergii TaxID=79674 RepID=UPI0034D71435